MIRNFRELRDRVVHGKNSKVIALAAADELSLESLRDAVREVGVEYLLVGDRDEIIETCKLIDFNIDESKVVHAYSQTLAAEVAVELVREKRADILMKGKLQTGALLKAVLDKERGIRQGGLMSHMAVIESPNYHKLLFVTDGGMNVSPDLEQKRAILENALAFMRKLGYERPKAAALAAVETINEKMPETVDAGYLAKMGHKGEFGDCIVEGPLAFDLAISHEAAKIKNIDSRVAGSVDLLLAPNISAGNILAKSLLFLGGAVMAGCVLGAAAPIILVSRGATAQEKLYSILLTLAT